MKKICENCRFWEEKATDDLGSCDNKKVDSFIQGWEVEGFEPDRNFGCRLWEVKL